MSSRRKAAAAGAATPAPTPAPEGARAALFTFVPPSCEDAEALATAQRAALRVPPPPTGAFARLRRCVVGAGQRTRAAKRVRAPGLHTPSAAQRSAAC
jgi:hypothetical protein